MLLSDVKFTCNPVDHLNQKPSLQVNLIPKHTQLNDIDRLKGTAALISKTSESFQLKQLAQKYT